MKRFVYVPLGMAQDGIPEIAKKMAKDSHLSIRVGEINDEISASEIEIISTPEKINIDYKPSVDAGLIYSIDITNEFVNFDTTTFLEVFDEGCFKVFKPRLREKHVVKFRARFVTPGAKVFSIRSENGTKYHEGCFEVI